MLSNFFDLPPVKALHRARTGLGGLVVAAIAAAALPTTVVALASSDWFQLLTGGSSMLCSGESIGSLPAYLTPADETPVPGLTPQQNALQTAPALQLDVPHESTYQAVAYASGSGYAFVGPSSTSATNARIRLFGSLEAKVSVLVLDGRNNSLSWHVGSSFVGAKLVTSTPGKTSVSMLPASATAIPIPIDLWKSVLETSAVSMTLVRADGVKASLALTMSGGQLTLIQFVP